MKVQVISKLAKADNLAEVILEMSIKVFNAGGDVISHSTIMDQRFNILVTIICKMP